jgi:transcriptional regulator with XRE-family HTH domain
MVQTQSEIAREVGRRIQRIRATTGVSARVLAECADMDLTNFQRIERGIGNPTIATLVQIATALEIDVAELVTGLERPAARPRALWLFAGQDPPARIPRHLLEDELPQQLTALRARVAPAERHAEVARLEAAQAYLVLIVRQDETPLLDMDLVTHADQRTGEGKRLVGGVRHDGMGERAPHPPRRGNDGGIVTVHAANIRKTPDNRRKIRMSGVVSEPI